MHEAQSAKKVVRREYYLEIYLEMCKYLIRVSMAPTRALVGNPGADLLIVFTVMNSNIIECMLCSDRASGTLLTQSLLP